MVSGVLMKDKVDLYPFKTGSFVVFDYRVQELQKGIQAYKPRPFSLRRALTLFGIISGAVLVTALIAHATAFGHVAREVGARNASPFMQGEAVPVEQIKTPVRVLFGDAECEVAASLDEKNRLSMQILPVHPKNEEDAIFPFSAPTLDQNAASGLTQAPQLIKIGGETFRVTVSGDGRSDISALIVPVHPRDGNDKPRLFISKHPRAES